MWEEFAQEIWAERACRDWNRRRAFRPSLLRGLAPPRKVLCLLTLTECIGGAPLPAQGVPQEKMGLFQIRLCCQGLVQLEDCAGEVAFREKGAAGLQSKAGTLLIHRLAAQIGGLLTLGGSAGAVAQCCQDGSQRDVRAGLVGLESDGMP